MSAVEDVLTTLEGMTVLELSELLIGIRRRSSMSLQQLQLRPLLLQQVLPRLKTSRQSLMSF